MRSIIALIVVGTLYHIHILAPGFTDLISWRNHPQAPPEIIKHRHVSEARNKAGMTPADYDTKH